MTTRWVILQERQQWWQEEEAERVQGGRKEDHVEVHLPGQKEDFHVSQIFGFLSKN